ncbi:hypothetical protein [Rathayibacter sp. VKM Ac-2927]|uniref:hypothetical protein n=1 Tax=Rathayibacter sp. VKM Ac-2927 TaxID=2929478 RepID=UPI001FB1DE72|nr:hypothetical protein [Rathayibacter sp. VKM Ac-2927]MCJ1688150.1 hypothetical protein [Rathayibacter sp. VKM Ac-2927]
MTSGTWTATDATGTTTSGTWEDTTGGISTQAGAVGPVSWHQRVKAALFAAWKDARLQSILIIVALAGLVILFVMVANFVDGGAVVLAVIAAGLLFIKEALTTMSRASKLKPLNPAFFEDLAAICSLFAAVFGAPAIVAGLIKLTNG